VFLLVAMMNSTVLHEQIPQIDTGHIFLYHSQTKSYYAVIISVWTASTTQNPLAINYMFALYQMLFVNIFLTNNEQLNKT